MATSPKTRPPARRTDRTVLRVSSPGRKARSKARGAATSAPLPFEISRRVERQALTRPYERQPGTPLYRPLRIYTLDPSV